MQETDQAIRTIMDQLKIERMLRQMKMLTNNKNYTIDELAERLGILYRSIYRYIDTFKDSGFVVEKLHSCFEDQSSEETICSIQQHQHRKLYRQ